MSFNLIKTSLYSQGGACCQSLVVSFKYGEEKFENESESVQMWTAIF